MMKQENRIWYSVREPKCSFVASSWHGYKSVAAVCMCQYCHAAHIIHNCDLSSNLFVCKRQSKAEPSLSYILQSKKEKEREDRDRKKQKQGREKDRAREREKEDHSKKDGAESDHDDSTEYENKRSGKDSDKKHRKRHHSGQDSLDENEKDRSKNSHRSDRKKSRRVC